MAKEKEELPGSDEFIAPGMSQRERDAIMADPATHLAMKRGQHIEIFHIPSGESIKFKAYIDDFQDKYDSDWQSTDVYGRMDPIHQYQGTKRVISLDWIVPSYSVAEAKHNHQKCSLLFSMMYPNYNVDGTGRSSATQISTAPLFKVKFGNLIQDPSAGEGGADAESSGLVGAISGFTYAPNVDAGFIDNQSGAGSAYAGGFHGQLYPKEVKLSMEYTVFHTSPLGWKGANKRTEGFPYGGQGAASSSDAGEREPGFKEEKYGIGTNGGGMDEQEISATNEVLE